jgi:hypothetical protein
VRSSVDGKLLLRKNAITGHVSALNASHTKLIRSDSESLGEPRVPLVERLNEGRPAM